MPDNLGSLEGTLGLPEGAIWDNTGAMQLTYDLGGTASRIAYEATTPKQLPLAYTMWGTCDARQLTPGGLRDTSRHGKVRARILSSPHSQCRA